MQPNFVMYLLLSFISIFYKGQKNKINRYKNLKLKIYDWVLKIIL